MRTLGVGLLMATLVSIGPAVGAATWEAEQVDDIAGAGHVFPTFIADADNDGQNELLASTHNNVTNSGVVRVYKWNGTTWTPQTIATLTKRAFIHAVGDADNDGENEVLVSLNVEPIFGNSQAELRVYKYSEGIWSYTLVASGGAGAYQGTIGDADGDGQNEIVVGGYNLGKMLLFRYVSGSYVESQIDVTSETSALPAVGDAMNLGTPQVYFGTHQSGHVYAYRWLSGAWVRSTVEANTGYIAIPYVVDLDNDGLWELLVTKYNGAWGIKLYQYSGGSWQGAVVRPEDTGNLSVGDVDGDGQREIVTRSTPNGRAVLAYKQSGSNWISSTVIPDVGFTISSLAVGDARNDGRPAILLAQEGGGQVWLYRPAEGGACGNGTVEPGEQCDDGNTEDGDCCSSTCEFEPVGSPCPDADVCNGDEVCDGNGACQAAGPLDCNDGRPCTQDSCNLGTGCANDEAQAADCRMAEKSLVLIKEKGGGYKLSWKWLKGEATSQQDFADPTGTAEYGLCVYAGAAGTLVAETTVLPDAEKWTAISTKGYKYKDAGAADGIQKVVLKGGAANNAKLFVKGGGVDLPVPDLPLVLQLVNSETGICWESVYGPGDVKMNAGSQFTARSQAP